MSLFAKIFGPGKSGKPPSPQEAIQKLRETEEMLLKKSDFLEKKIDHETATAKKAGMKNKRVALQALKRKKRYEENLKKIDGTLTTIEYQREALENASTNKQVLDVMGKAASALKAAHGNMNVDDVHNLMDDVAEQREVADEISEAISNPAGFNVDIDEDDLLAELEDMEQEDLDRQLLEVGGETEDLPSVPTAEPSERAPAKAAAANQEDDDMRELEMWAS